MGHSTQALLLKMNSDSVLRFVKLLSHKKASLMVNLYCSVFGLKNR